MVFAARLLRISIPTIAIGAAIWLLSGGVHGEEHLSGRSADVWTFYEAWRVFRFDLDATLPGGNEEILLVGRLHNEPQWLTRDGLRQARNPETLAFLARRVARSRDPKAVAALRRAALTTPNEKCRRTIEWALMRLGDETTQNMLALRLREGSPTERRQAATTLGAAGHTAAPLLSAALEDPDVQTQIAAAAVLAIQGNRRARQLLYKLLISNNPSHRLEAAHSLAQTGDTRAIGPLRDEFQRRGSYSLRIVRSLGYVGGSKERNLLVKTWLSLPRGRSLALRQELLLALGRIAVKNELSGLGPHFRNIEEEEENLTGVRAAQLRTLGWAVTRGARKSSEFPALVRQSLDRPLPEETPVAFTLRKTQVTPLLVALAGRPQREKEGVQQFEASTESLVLAIRAKNIESATERSQRFDGAVELLKRLGKQLGHARYADPTAKVTPVGLNAERSADGNFLTSWIAGKMAGTLRLDLPAPLTVSALQLIGGCVDSPTSYREHARVRELRISADGHPPIKAMLSDNSPYFQRISLGNIRTKRLNLRVSKIYPGERDNAPACIAEVRVEMHDPLNE